MLEIEPVFKHEDRTARTGGIATSAKREEVVVDLAVPLNDRLLGH